MFAVKMSAPAPCYAKSVKEISRDPCACLSFAEEILLQRTLSTNIVLKGDVPVCTKGTGKHSDVTEHGFPEKRKKVEQIRENGRALFLTAVCPRCWRSCTRSFEQQLLAE